MPRPAPFGTSVAKHLPKDFCESTLDEYTLMKASPA